MTHSKAILVLSLIGITGMAGCGGDSESSPRGSISSNGVAATITNTVETPADMAVGDIYQIAFAGSQQGVIDLSGVASDTEYVLAVANLSTTGATSQVQLSGSLHAPSSGKQVQGGDAQGSLSPSAFVGDGNDYSVQTLQEAFDEQLRGMEQVVSLELPVAPHGARAAKSVTPVPEPLIGDTDTFRVLSSFGSFSQYDEVVGEVRCVGTRVVFYVDREVAERNPQDLTDGDLQTLCARFDLQVALMGDFVGAPSDINGDGRVAVLFTPAVNRVGAAGGGIVTGFFFANDLHARSSGNPLSNEREILYLVVPDTQGIYGINLSRDLALNNLIPAVLPHELQHAISYGTHVLEQGSAPEVSWLNEGLSHLIEDLLMVGQENPSRYAYYLPDTSAYQVVTSNSPGLVSRGAIFLFLRYLYEQSGNNKAFVWNMLHNTNAGVDNVETAYESTDESFDQFSEFLLRWSAALVLNDTGLTKDTRFGYQARQWDAADQQYSGVCTICDADDNRGTALQGVNPSILGGNRTAHLPPATVQYFQVSGDREQVALWAAGGGSYGAILIRIK